MAKMLDQIVRLETVPSPTVSSLAYVCTISGVNPENLAVQWKRYTNVTHPVDFEQLERDATGIDVGAAKPVTPMDVDIAPVDENPVPLYFRLKNTRLTFFAGDNDYPFQAIAGSTENGTAALVNPRWAGGTAGARNAVMVLAVNGRYRFKYNLGIIVASSPPNGIDMPIILDPNANNTGWPPGKTENNC